MSDYAECSTEVNRKARKRHICCECGGHIAKGETYNYISGIWDSEPMSFKTCLDCFNFKNEAIKDERCRELPPYEGLSDWLMELNVNLACKWVSLVANRDRSLRSKVFIDNYQGYLNKASRKGDNHE